MNVKFFLALLLFSFGTISCVSNNDDSTPKASYLLTLSADSLSFEATGGSASVKVAADREWGTHVSEKWLHVSPSTSTKRSTELVVSAETNPLTQDRKGKITIMSGTERAVIDVRQAGGEPDPNAPKGPKGYHLVWADEFNEGTELNASDWTHEVKGAGWVNNELQNYVDGSYNGRRVTEIKDGKLIITAFKNNGKVYSGRVYAHMHTGWTYGYFEARMKLLQGRGTWPAFWMMPVNNDYQTNPWPRCGEIDIMEEVGVVPNEVSSSIHCQAYNHVIGTQKTAKRNIGTAETAFHVYACEWTADYLRFYIDGVELMTFENDGKRNQKTWPFKVPFYPIFNLAWGGNWGGMRGVDESALPCQLEIDYLRVFQKK